MWQGFQRQIELDFFLRQQPGEKNHLSKEKLQLNVTETQI